MKVLMLNPPFLRKFSRSSRSPAISKGGCVYYPIWLAYATGVLEQAGHQVKLIDAPASNQTREEILGITRELKPKLIVVDSSTPSIENDVQVVNQLKEALPEAFIVMVGTHVSVLPEEVLKSSDKIDAVARHEYDFTVRELAERLEKNESLENVPGLSLHQKGKIRHNPDRPLMSSEDLDSIPFVSQVYLNHLNIQDYFYPANLYPEVTIVSGRGCPHRCTYCVNPQTLYGHKYRARSVENVIEEFKFIKKNFPEVKEIFIEDDTFTADRIRAREFSDKLLASGVKITWSCNARADVDLITLEKMKAAGCRLMCVGVESASQEILNSIKKGTTVEGIRQFMKDAKKAGILVHGCFMLGNKGETKETARQTINFAKELNPDTAQFFPIMVYPGTEAFNWAKENNYLDTLKWSEWLTKEGVHNSIVSTPQLSAQELVELSDHGRMEFYMRPKYIFSKAKQMVLHPTEIPRILKSTKTFFKYLLKGRK